MNRCASSIQSRLDIYFSHNIYIHTQTLYSNYFFFCQTPIYTTQHITYLTHHRIITSLTPSLLVHENILPGSQTCGGKDLIFFENGEEEEAKKAKSPATSQYKYRYLFVFLRGVYGIFPHRPGASFFGVRKFQVQTGVVCSW